MDKKKLAGLIKDVRKNKLNEQTGKSASFDPAHHKGTHGEDPESPNQYAHGKKVTEQEVSQSHAEPGLGHRHDPKTSIFAHAKVPIKRTWQKKGNQSRDTQSYVAEKEESTDLGKTDTGKKSKKETETVDVNPKMPAHMNGSTLTNK